LLLHGKNREADTGGICGDGKIAAGDIQRANDATLLGTTMIETKDSILFARPDGKLVLFLRGYVRGRVCYTRAICGERVQCQVCGVSVRVVAESRTPFRFICLDCEDRELAERASCAGNA